MQVQESSPEPSPLIKDGPLKANLKPAKRRSHARSSSHNSEASRKDGLQDDDKANQPNEMAKQPATVTAENNQEQAN